LKVSDPKEHDADLGALISETHHRKVVSYIELAKAEAGVNILCGGALQLGGKNQKVNKFLAKTDKINDPKFRAISSHQPL
jgi:acyl-CoA reductase-like NAD-dependent aldehyde dehydrogenase